MEVLNYEQLVADFEIKLLTQLRNFGSDAEYLEMWVPDEDPVMSILNMVEAAEAFGRNEIAVQVGVNTLPVDRVNDLIARIGELGQVEARAEAGQIVVVVTEIGQR